MYAGFLSLENDSFSFYFSSFMSEVDCLGFGAWLFPWMLLSSLPAGVGFYFSGVHAGASFCEACWVLAGTAETKLPEGS